MAAPTTPGFITISDGPMTGGNRTPCNWGPFKAAICRGGIEAHHGGRFVRPPFLDVLQTFRFPPAQRGLGETRFSWESWGRQLTIFEAPEDLNPPDHRRSLTTSGSRPLLHNPPGSRLADWPCFRRSLLSSCTGRPFLLGVQNFWQ